MLSAGVLSTGSAAAQNTSDRGTTCKEGRIADVKILTHQVFDASKDGALGTLYSIGNSVHFETRKGFVRRELLFHPGDCIDPLRLSESARLLRQHGFLKSATIETVPRGDGTYDVIVDTQDDWTLRFEPRLVFGDRVEFTGIVLEERSILGTGRALMFAYRNRTTFGAVYSNPQFMKRRWNLALSAGRTEGGDYAGGGLSYPFVGLVGRKAGFSVAGYNERWFRFVAGDSPEEHEVIQPFIRTTAQFGGAVRKAGEVRGRETKLGSLGASISYERLDYGSLFFNDTTVATELGESEQETDSIAQQIFAPRNTLRLNLMFGLQALQFIQRRGLTTLDAVEDIPLGVSGGLMLGIAAPVLGTTDSYVFAGLEGFVGVELSRKWLAVLRGSFESRRDYDDNAWRDVFGTVEARGFWQLSRRHTVDIGALFSAGWDATVPFQLTLGGGEGVRGYSLFRFPGGARAVVSVEERAFLGSIGELFDVGTVVFFDAGRMWANEAPFGSNSRLRASVGVGLRFSTPTESRTTYQIELATPLGAGEEGLIFRVRIGRIGRIERRPPDFQLERSRDPALRNALVNLQ